MKPQTPNPEKQTVGLALGGGGARGLAHIPALEVLDARGIAPAMIAGTSMGAIIGALYAAGRSGREIRHGIREHMIAEGDGFRDIYRKRTNLFKWLKAVKPSWHRTGLLDAGGFLSFLLEQTRVDTFEALKIPLRVVATDFHTGEAVVFSKGPLLPAIRASMSIPGVFVPVEHEGRVLVDGGVVNNVPYDLLLESCDRTIAVDVTPSQYGPKGEVPHMLDATIGMFDIMIARVTALAMERHPPDIYVRPRLSGIQVLEFDKLEDVYRQSEPVMNAFRERLEAKGLEGGPVTIAR